MKIVILAQGTIYADIIIQRLLKKRGEEVKAIIISNALLSGKSFLKSIRDMIKISGFQIFLLKLLDLTFFSARVKSNQVPKYGSKNVNSQKVIKLLKKIEPDLIISVFFNQILSKEILRIPSKGCINIHPSYLPRYRGIGPTFWVLSNNEKETGITIHCMGEGIDNGDILAQERIRISPRDTVHRLYLKCAQEGAKIIERVLANIENQKVVTKKQDEEEATYFSVPTRKGMINFKKNSKKFFTTYELLKGFIFKITKRPINGKNYYLD